MRWMKLESYFGKAPFLPGTAGESTVSLSEDVFLNAKTLGFWEYMGSNDNSLMGTPVTESIQSLRPIPFQGSGSSLHVQGDRESCYLCDQLCNPARVPN